MAWATPHVAPKMTSSEYTRTHKHLTIFCFWTLSAKVSQLWKTAYGRQTEVLKVSVSLFILFGLCCTDTRTHTRDGAPLEDFFISRGRHQKTNIRGGCQLKQSIHTCVFCVSSGSHFTPLRGCLSPTEEAGKHTHTYTHKQENKTGFPLNISEQVDQPSAVSWVIHFECISPQWALLHHSRYVVTHGTMCLSSERMVWCTQS